MTIEDTFNKVFLLEMLVFSAQLCLQGFLFLVGNFFLFPNFLKNFFFSIEKLRITLIFQIKQKRNNNFSYETWVFFRQFSKAEELHFSNTFFG